MFKNRQLSYTSFEINEFLDNFRAIRGQFTSFYSIKRKDQNYRHICALFYWIWKKGTKRNHKLGLPNVSGCESLAYSALCSLADAVAPA